MADAFRSGSSAENATLYSPNCVSGIMLEVNQTKGDFACESVGVGSSLMSILEIRLTAKSSSEDPELSDESDPDKDPSRSGGRLKFDLNIG